jgi:hypothetical protein
VTKLLLDWGDRALEKSSNQAVLPHAIIVLNKAESITDEDDWDIRNSTEWLFQGMDEDLHNNARFTKYTCGIHKEAR